MRPLEVNDIRVCRDYVNNVYEQIDYFSKDWAYFVELDLDNPKPGLDKIFSILEVSGVGVNEYLSAKFLNKNVSGLKHKIDYLRYNIKHTIMDFMHT